VGSGNLHVSNTILSDVSASWLKKVVKEDFEIKDIPFCVLILCFCWRQGIFRSSANHRLANLRLHPSHNSDIYRPVVIANANDGSDRLFIAEKSEANPHHSKQRGSYTNIPELYQQGIKWWN